MFVESVDYALQSRVIHRPLVEDGDNLPIQTQFFSTKININQVYNKLY